MRIGRQPERFDPALVENALDTATAAVTAPMAPVVADKPPA